MSTSALEGDYKAARRATAAVSMASTMGLGEEKTTAEMTGRQRDNEATRKEETRKRGNEVEQTRKASVIYHKETERRI